MKRSEGMRVVITIMERVAVSDRIDMMTHRDIRVDMDLIKKR